jgi:hypothetical protein
LFENKEVNATWTRRTIHFNERFEVICGLAMQDLIHKGCEENLKIDPLLNWEPM